MVDKIDTSNMNPRAKACWEFECYAPDGFFVRHGKWEHAVSDGDKKLVEKYGMPCQGDGLPGTWCSKCYWGYSDDLVRCPD